MTLSKLTEKEFFELYKAYERNTAIYQEQKGAGKGVRVVRKNYSDGTKQTEIHYLNNMLHRIGGPAVIKYSKHGNILSETWYINNLKHRIDDPAVIEYYENGKKRTEKWFTKGHSQRNTGPAFIEYYKTGKKSAERWDYIDGRSGRETLYYENGNAELQVWYVGNGILHRTDGPAKIVYHKNGQIKLKEWYINGNKTDEEANRGQKGNM